MRVAILTFFFTIFSVVAFTQYTPEDAEGYPETTKEKNPLNKLSFKDRLYTGGNMQLGMSNGIFIIDATPLVGYRITQKFSTGVSAKYMYIGSRYYGSYSIYGGGVFSRYLFNDNFFAHTEYELLRAYNLNSNSSSYNQRDWANMFFIGGGYRTRMGGNGAIQIMLLYDLINHVNSPYQWNYISPGVPIIYRIGFTFGL